MNNKLTDKQQIINHETQNLETDISPLIKQNSSYSLKNNNNDNNSFISSLKENPYFSAGFGLVGIGALLSILKQLTNISYTIIRKRCTVSLEVVSRDKSYDWVLKWIDVQLKKRSQHISVSTQYEKNETNDRVTTNFSFLPSLGIHYFKYNKNWIRAERSREQTIDRMTGFPVETLKLTALGNNVKVFSNLLEESREKAVKDLVGKTSIYSVLGTDWKQFGHSNIKRPFKSVVLDKNVAENLLSDVKDFLNNSKWYQDRGIPYRRGYLLYGPPGCGKTSFITALAGQIDHDIAIANLSDRSISDDRLSVLFSKAPLRTIILLEDIDAAFRSREIETKDPIRFEGMARLTLSGLLNTLDGVSESHGRIVFMTTNYIERLDPAMIRPGRVDVRQFIGYMTEYQIHKMFLKFYPNANEKKIEYFTKKLVEMNKKISPAILQGYFMLCKNDPEKALESIEFFKEI